MERRNAPFAYDLCSGRPDQGKSLVGVGKEDWQGNQRVEVLNEIADIKKEQRETKDKLEKHIQDDDERDANMHRQRILRFNIELMRGEDFTLECFNDMLLDIDEYERFCETHPGYKNNRAVMAIANIKRVYQDHEENGGFLV